MHVLTRTGGTVCVWRGGEEKQNNLSVPGVHNEKVWPFSLCTTSTETTIKLLMTPKLLSYLG